MQNLITIFTLLCLVTACSKKAEPIVLIEGEPQEISQIRGYFHEMKKDKDGIPVKVKAMVESLNKDDTKDAHFLAVDSINSLYKGLFVKDQNEYDIYREEMYKKDACRKLRISESSSNDWEIYIKNKTSLKYNNDYWKLYKVSLFLERKFHRNSRFKIYSLTRIWKENCNE